MTKTIALLTDFGRKDIYVGVMKGVMRGICPEAHFIDITHQIEPQNVRLAALALMNSYAYFPPGTVFLCVVDPGVGSTRLPIAMQADDRIFVAPDNGLLSYVASRFTDVKVHALTNPAYQLPALSNTFHGRDVFAPGVAHLAAGVPLNTMGDERNDMVQLPLPHLALNGRRVDGEVVDIDRFGNLITSIGYLEWVTSDRVRLKPAFAKARLPEVPVEVDSAKITVHDEEIFGIRTAYSEALRGDLLAVVGSSGYLEISVNQGSAAARLEASIGDLIQLQIGDVDAAIRD